MFTITTSSQQPVYHRLRIGDKPKHDSLLEGQTDRGKRSDLTGGSRPLHSRGFISQTRQ